MGIDIITPTGICFHVQMSDYVAPAFAVVLPNLGGIAGAFLSRRAAIPNWFEVSNCMHGDIQLLRGYPVVLTTALTRSSPGQ